MQRSPAFVVVSALLGSVLVGPAASQDEPDRLAPSASSATSAAASRPRPAEPPAASPVARAGSPGSLEAPLESVALFKNGLGLFVRKAEAKGGPGTYVVRPLPAPIHGTLWVNAPEGVKLNHLVAETVRIPLGEATAARLPELLQANVGRSVVLHLAGGGTSGGTSMEGRIERVLTSIPPSGLPAPRLGWNPSPEPPAPQPPPAETPETVLLAQGGGRIVAIPLGAVVWAEFPGAVATSLPAATVEGKQLRLELARADAGRTFEIVYVAKGISWAPSYRIDLRDDGRARFQASAVVSNEIEDLEGVRVDLVTGFPNLKLEHVPSPLALAQGLAAFLQGLDAEPGQDAGRGGYGAQMMTANFARLGQAEEVALSPPQSGTAHEDLFLYPLERVTLRRGAAGYYPLFVDDVPYTHVYEWDIPDYVMPNDTYGGSQPGEPPPQIVWHSVRLENTTKVPWTTAPAETTREGMVLGQDVLRYTAPGKPVTVRITQAVNVRAAEGEREIAREPIAEPQRGSYFDRVRIRGELVVENGLDRAITVEVKKQLSGELVESVPKAVVTAKAKGLRPVNPSLDLTWKLPLAPGAKSELAYTYIVLVRR